MNSRLEEFVRDVEKRLAALPAATREEEITEIRQHLEALAAAEQELGASEIEAAGAAIRQFGTAPTVARDLNGVGWRRHLRRIPDTAVAAMSTIAVNPIVMIAALFTVYPLLEAALPPSSLIHPPSLVQILFGLWPWLACAAAAATVLVLRDGIRVALRRCVEKGSCTNITLRWLIAYKLLQDAAETAQNHRVGHVLLPDQMWWGIPLLVASILGPAAIVGWHFTRTGGAKAGRAILATFSTLTIIQLLQNASVFTLARVPHLPRMLGMFTCETLIRVSILAFAVWMASNLSRRSAARPGVSRSR